MDKESTKRLRHNSSERNLNMIEEKVIWQIYDFEKNGHNFKIRLDRDFAVEMLNTKISRDLKKEIKERGHQEIVNRGYIGKPKFVFYKNTAFVLQFSLGNNGRRLYIPQRNKRNPLEVYPEGDIKYSSRGMGSASNSYSIFRLIDLWVQNKDMIKEQTNNS